MDCIFWNCRGANKPNFRRALRYMLKRNTVDVLALFETHAEGERANRICQNLGFDNYFKVDAAGQSGGLWLLWRTSVGQVTINQSSDQFIHVLVEKGGVLVNLVVVYAAPSVGRRSGLWGDLEVLIKGVVGPVIVGGDFNTIVRNDERSGGNGKLSQDSLTFGDWINELALIDMGFKGNKFTWKRGRTVNTFVAKRLDRILCCAQARLKWQEASVTHLPFLSSDHSPLYMQLCPKTKGNPRRRPFRFEAAWLQHAGFKELMRNSWNPEINTTKALDGLRLTLRKWNKEVFGEVSKRKAEVMEGITGVQKLLEQSQTNDLLLKESALLKDLDNLLEQEETIWFQKSREKWLECGDRNTSFFHTSTIIRRKRNKIEALRNGDGEWVSDIKELERMVIEYYDRLYSLVDIPTSVDSLPSTGFPCLSEVETRELNKIVKEDEVVNAVRCMGSYKAPGPDGYQPIFYQQCWETVGSSVIRFALEFFTTCRLPDKTNDVLLVLLPKVANPETVTQFRPISLCNVLFKVITKIMVIRLKSVISNLIGPAQSSFIPGRLNADNIVIVQEAVHSMRRKKGRKGWMLLKLDLEKAYDRIRWDFLADTLEASGLSEKWRIWVMECVTKTTMSVLMNGEKTQEFRPSRGLRQGDPLSPYLFVLCLERLCHLIDASIGNGEWKPIRLSRGGPQLSHICFADDLILFGEASVTQVRIIRRVLERFCVASGQKVSLEKSKIFFSGNVNRELAKQISEESGIGVTLDLGKYLGMPILQKRINKDTFGETVERVSSRLAGWKGRTLSLAGRLTLTKSVLSALPTHTMSTIMLPATTLEKLDKLSRIFLWGSSPEKKKQHLVAWKNVCKKKVEGGLGLRSAREMNKALVSKLGWRVLQDKDNLWAKVLRKKYNVGEVHDCSWLLKRNNWSSTWRSVVVGLSEVISKGIGWAPGNGELINFWCDKWLMTTPLIDLVRTHVPYNELRKKAIELWEEGSGWIMGNIAPYLPGHITLRLSSVVLNGFLGVGDTLSWMGTTDGCFTVKSAYDLLCQDNTPRPCMKVLWDRVWSVIAPERVRVFLWVAFKQVLMTNHERVRRHLAVSELCQVCNSDNETTIHVLRDCPAVEGLWTRLVPAQKRRAFFSQTLFEWLYENLDPTTKGIDMTSWQTTFAMTLWWSWKWRCMDVFGSTVKYRDRIGFVKRAAMEVTMSHQKRRKDAHGAATVERMITWVKPETGWVKLNTDGASRGNPGVATAGGVVRDRDGRWQGGFALHIGVCSGPIAELWGVYYGLIVAWDKGFRRVVVEVDSEMVVKFLQTGINNAHPLSFLVRMCQGFCSRDWRVRFCHVYREANRLADGLANYAFGLHLGLHLLELVPFDVVSLFTDDAEGLASPRLIRL